MEWRSLARQTWSAVVAILRFVLWLVFPDLDLRDPQERLRAEAKERAERERSKAIVGAMFAAVAATEDLEARYERGAIVEADYVAEREAIRATLPPSRSRAAPQHARLGIFAVFAGMVAAYVVAVAIAGRVVLTVVGLEDVPTGAWIATVGGAATLGAVAVRLGRKVQINDGTFLLLGVPLLVLVVVFGVVRP